MVTIARNSSLAFIKASRLQTLGATLCPVFLGTAFAYSDGSFNGYYFFLTLITAMFMQVLTNLINDYGDFRRGADSHNRLGPMRAMQMGWLSEKAMKMAIVLLMFLIVSLGFLLIIRGGLPIFFLGSLGLLTGCLYTLGPWPLAYVGFVEVIIFFIFGPAEVIGTYYIQSLTLSNQALVMSLSPGFLACALNLTNNLRDLHQDKKVNKRTIAVRLGERFTRFAIVGCVFFAMMGPVILVIRYSFSPLILVVCCCLLPGIFHMRMMLQEPISSRFNLMLHGLGKSLYLLAVMGSLGVIYAAP